MALPLRYNKLFRVRVLVVCSLVVFGCMFSQDSFSSNDEQSKAPKTDYSELKRFRQVLEILRKNYVEEISDRELMRAATQGMLKSLDHNNAFLSEDEYSQFQVETEGEFGGLGIEIALDGGVLTVVSPIEDTPAFKAGIKPGDKIIEINGESTKNITLNNAVKQMRGPKGTRGMITVMREGWTKFSDVTLTRDIIHVHSVKKETLEPGYQYIRLVNFQETTDTDLVQAIKEMGDDEKIKGMVLDLRNNPGGLLDQAVKVTNLFITKGLIVYTDGRVKDQRMEFRASQTGKHYKFKVAVLINEGSASASEILAGALQDHDRALIFGTKSNGHDSIKTLIPLDNGCGIRLVTANYFRPKGRQIDKIGIQPDVDLSQEIEAQDSRLTDETQKARYYSKSVDPKNDIVLYKAIDWLKSDLTVEDYKNYKRN